MSLIKKTAVLGAGVMGSTIAAQLANAGSEVLLLDIVPQSPSADETARGWTLDNPEVRNRLSEAGLEKALTARPAAFYLPRILERPHMCYGKKVVLARQQFIL